MCARGGIGRRDGFRSHSERVRVQVLSGAPTKSPILSGFFAYERKDFWQTQRIGTPAVSLRNKHSLRQIPLCIIAILMPLEFGVEVDFDVELFIFF